MFRLSYDKKSKYQGVIVSFNPPQRLGPFTDSEGKKWDINGIYGPSMNEFGVYEVKAVRYSSLHPYYSSTANVSFGLVTQTWLPYLVVTPEQKDEMLKKLEEAKQ